MFLKRDNTIHNTERKNIRKTVLIIVSAIVFIILVGSISGYLYIKSALGPVDSESTKKIAINIPVGSSSSEIGKILEDNQVIKDGRVFRFYTRFTKETGFRAGDYVFPQTLELNEVIRSLQKGRSPIEARYKITIPEGMTLDEIATIYAKEMPFTKEQFLEKVNDRDYVKELIQEYDQILSNDILHEDIRAPLEGYLFAATYEYNQEDPDLESVIERMLAKTNQILIPYLDVMEEQGFTIHEAVTFASIVEKETGTVDQRKEISGVFYNRLQKGMRLQTDPTVLYALGKHKSKVILKDLDVKSPYNTYRISGLPVGPISNFGKDALDAALYPEDTDFIYFLHDAKGDIYFSETHDEHIEMKQKHIK